MSTERRFPPVIEIVTVSLGCIVVGGIVMASYAPRRPPLTLPTILLLAGGALLVAGIAMLTRVPGFAWGTFGLVAKWALLAYVIESGMIFFAFARNHVRGAPLAVVALMLVVFALDVPMLIAATVARYHDS